MRVVLIYIITLLFSSASWGEEAKLEKDPFFPPERGLLAPAAPSAEDGWGRDPFTSPLTEKMPGRTGEGPGEGKKPVTGIIYSKKSRVAMIGGDMVQEGSMVGDRRVVEIRRRSVIFQTASGGYEEVYVDDFSIGK